MRLGSLASTAKRATKPAAFTQASDRIPMNTQTQTQTEVTTLDLAVERHALAKLRADEARKDLIALLPEASVNHMTIILKATADGEPVPEGCRPDVDVRLNATQKAQVKKAAEERAAWCTKNADTIIAEAREGSDLTAYSIRVGAKATIRRLTFTQSHGSKPGANRAAQIRENFEKIAAAKPAEAKPEPANQALFDELTAHYNKGLIALKEYTVKAKDLGFEVSVTLPEGM